VDRAIGEVAVPPGAVASSLGHRKRAAVGIAALVALLAAYPFAFAGALNFGFGVVLFAALATSWDLIGGWAGQLSLGHAAFIGLGAYTFTLLTRAQVPIGVAVLVAAAAGVLLAAAWGFITFRLRGAYFALASIAVAEVLRIVANNWTSLTGGPEGLSLQDLPQVLGLDLYDRRVEFYLALALLAAALAISLFIGTSRAGYYLEAIREDQDSSMALGVDPLRMKLFAFCTSAALTVLGGCLYAVYLAFFEPHGVFSLDLSVQLVLMSIVGGMGTVFGPALGAVVLLVFQEAFRNAFQQSSLLIYGILIVIMVRYAPDGLSGRVQLLYRRLARWLSRSPSAT
jgi:branched-chain amino acid transport system permease protein